MNANVRKLSLYLALSSTLIHCGGDPTTSSSTQPSSSVSSSSVSSIAPPIESDYLPADNEVPTPLAPVVVDPTVQFQTHTGFGTSLAWFANVIGGWPDAERQKIADLLFDPIAGLGINIVRYNIGGGENPSHNHMRTGGEMEGFQPSEGTWDWNADKNQRWVLQAAKQRAGSEFIAEAFANSPPYWMTYSQCAAGNDPGSNNALREDRYDDFAQYLLKVAQHFKSEWGITFDTIEPLNEPEATWWKAFNGQEGAHFDTAAQAKIIDALAKEQEGTSDRFSISAMDAAGIGAAIDNYNAYSESTRGNLQQINAHGYHGSDEERNTLRNIAKAENKRLWMSESDGGGGNDPFAQFTHNPEDIAPGLDLSQRLYTVLKELQPSAWVFWQAVENWPNQISINKNWGLILADMDASSITSSQYRTTKKYSVFAQYAKHIRPNAKMVFVNRPDTVAFLNAKQDQLIVVATNHDNNARAFDIDLSRFYQLPDEAQIYRTSANEDYLALPTQSIENAVLRNQLPAKSVTTFVLNNIGFSNGRRLQGTFQFINRNSNLCLQANGDDALVTQSTCNQSENQRWSLDYQNDGTYSITNPLGNRILAIQGDKMKPAGEVILASGSDNADQRWSILDQGDGFFHIQSRHSQFLLDINSASTNSGAKAIQWHDNQGRNQDWIITP